MYLSSQNNGNSIERIILQFIDSVVIQLMS